MRVGIKAGIYIAAVLDYLVEDIFDIALNVIASDDSPKINFIRSHHLRMVMKCDNDLDKITKDVIIPIFSPKRNDDYE